MKAIKEKELENQFNIKAKEAEEEVSSIKETTNQQVLIRRSQLKEQIAAMRKKAQRRKARLAQQLISVRTVMAETMGKVYKAGDSSKCSNAMKNYNNKLSYCQASFSDDFSKFADCKESDDFCSLCCETEWGEMHINERHQCYKSLCKKATDPNSLIVPSITNTQNNAGGRWIRQKEMK
jgi:hypothetical protein